MTNKTDDLREQVAEELHRDVHAQAGMLNVLPVWPDEVDDDALAGYRETADRLLAAPALVALVAERDMTEVLPIQHTAPEDRCKQCWPKGGRPVSADDLREQVAEAVSSALGYDDIAEKPVRLKVGDWTTAAGAATDAVLSTPALAALIAERDALRAKVGVLGEVADERTRQDEKWGEQNHPNGTGLYQNQAAAERSRRVCDRNARLGKVTYADILREEFHEALAEDDPARLRAELIQVAAVAVAWVEKLDRDAARAALDGDA